MSGSQRGLVHAHLLSAEAMSYQDEFGGHGNIATLIAAIEAVVTRNPGMGDFGNPWFFPTANEYRMHLEGAGFVVHYIELIPRPTPLETGVREWLKVFANHVTSRMPDQLENEFLHQTERLLRPVLYSDSGGWHADYVRLRFVAVRTEQAARSPRRPVRAAREYGEIRAHLEKQGTPIGPMDTLIAAHASSRGLMLVTNNEQEFRRVPGLAIEN